MPLDIQAVYRVRSDARSIAERARVIAVEQSVEMPLEAIDDPFVNNEIVGRVLDIKDISAKNSRGGLFAVCGTHRGDPDCAAPARLADTLCAKP